MVGKYSYCCSDAGVFGCLQLWWLQPTEEQKQGEDRSCGWLREGLAKAKGFYFFFLNLFGVIFGNKDCENTY